MTAVTLSEGKLRISLGRKAAPVEERSCNLGDVTQSWCLMKPDGSCSKLLMISQPL